MKYTWLVEKYLEGELSGEALRKFELEILRKPEVAEEVERVRSMHYFMQEQHSKLQDSIGLIEDFDDMENVIDEEIIRQDLDGLKVRRISNGQKEVSDLQTKLTESKVSRTLVEQQSRKVLVRKVSVWLAAASIAILLGISLSMIIGNNGQVDYMAMYEKHYSAPEADLGVRGVLPMTDYKLYSDAKNYYNGQDYEKAYQYFDDLKSSPPEPTYYLFYGNSAMALGNHEKALEILEHIKIREKSIYVEAEWYRGLCHLALEDREAARGVFEHIVSIKGHNYKQAKKILRKL